MQFLDSSVPIATCEVSGCEGCSVADSVQCHFGPGDLIHFYLITLPVFLVGGAGILAVGWTPLIAWIVIVISFFGFIETGDRAARFESRREAGACHLGAGLDDT